ncbi:MAG: ABC transporter ATP-binding protein [Gallionellaceae bacterium]|nr:ABC transporter ATP-binding protein [Gallionellaceae bacterium]
MIELAAVTKTFNAGRPNEYQALRGVDLAIEAGRVTALRGPSGSGKTTLLTLIGCLARPSSGRVRLAGEDISALPERFLAELRLRRFGFVFQRFNLIPGLSALDNILLPAYPLGLPYHELRARADTLMASLEIDHRAATRVDWLSGGEVQRVAIARALINDPPVIIADEPTAHLDSRLSLEFLALLGRLKEAGKTVVIASHDPLVFETGLPDRVADLRDGRIVGVTP